MDKRKMVVSDLDDTLLTTDKGLTLKNIKTIQTLRAKGVVVTIATGRPLHFVRRVKGLEELVDYIIVSTGLGIWDCKNQEMIYQRRFSSTESDTVTDFLVDNSISFMKHNELPDNHFCQTFSTNVSNSDFNKRLLNFDGFCSSLQLKDGRNSSLFLLPGIATTDLPVIDNLKKKLNWASFVRITSPYDPKKYWVEILPTNVNKGVAVKKLVEHLGLNIENCMIIGNDYNDTDMLNLTERSYVVKNAVAELKEKFIVTDDCNNSGFTSAVLHSKII